MTIFHSKIYDGDRIEIDGNEYTSCTFNACTLVYKGGALPSLDGCKFVGCSWTFDGAAGRTVQLMAALYAGGAKEMIDKTLARIRSGEVL